MVVPIAKHASVATATTNTTRKAKNSLHINKSDLPVKTKKPNVKKMKIFVKSDTRGRESAPSKSEQEVVTEGQL